MHSHWWPEVYNKAFAAKIGKPPDEVNNPLYVDRQKRTAWMGRNSIQVHLALAVGPSRALTTLRRTGRRFASPTSSPA